MTDSSSAKLVKLGCDPFWSVLLVAAVRLYIYTRIYINISNLLGYFICCYFKLSLLFHFLLEVQLTISWGCM